jgi:hypothetical protein
VKVGSRVKAPMRRRYGYPGLNNRTACLENGYTWAPPWRHGTFGGGGGSLAGWGVRALRRAADALRQVRVGAGAGCPAVRVCVCVWARAGVRACLRERASGCDGSVRLRRGAAARRACPARRGSGRFYSRLL